jgi:hypothetical protein
MIEIPYLNHQNEETDNPEEAVKWQRVSNASLIEYKLLVRNKNRFGQAQRTFFTSEEVQNQFDYEGVTKAVKLLLKGEVNIPDSAIKTNGERTLLQHLANKNKIPDMDCKISKHMFVSTIRKWAENTSTSTSGRHLGHYKCLLTDDAHQYSETNPDPSEKIMDVYYKVATATIRIGASLDRWQQSITKMIEKQPDNPKINKL